MNTKPSSNVELMTIAEILEDLRISRAGWDKMAAAGRTPAIIKVGRIHRVRRSAYEAWLSQHEEAA